MGREPPSRHAVHGRTWLVTRFPYVLALARIASRPPGGYSPVPRPDQAHGRTRCTTTRPTQPGTRTRGGAPVPARRSAEVGRCVQPRDQQQDSAQVHGGGASMTSTPAARRSADKAARLRLLRSGHRGAGRPVIRSAAASSSWASMRTGLCAPPDPPATSSPGPVGPSPRAPRAVLTCAPVVRNRHHEAPTHVTASPAAGSYFIRAAARRS